MKYTKNSERANYEPNGRKNGYRVRSGRTIALIAIAIMIIVIGVKLGTSPANAQRFDRERVPEDQTGAPSIFGFEGPSVSSLASFFMLQKGNTSTRISPDQGSSGSGTIGPGIKVDGILYDTPPPRPLRYPDGEEDEDEQLGPPIPDEGINNPPTQLVETFGQELQPSFAPGTFTLFRSTALSGVPGGASSTVNEPSAGSQGDGIFQTHNWYAEISVNNGSTFSYVSPYTIFPNSPSEFSSGFCCDQRVAQDSSRDLVLWYLQYLKNGSTSTSTNGVRIAVTHGQAGLAANSWTYWNFTPASFGLPAGKWLDFPHMQTSANYAYFTSNIFESTTDTFYGAVVVRIPLDELNAGGVINFRYQTYIGSFGSIAAINGSNPEGTRPGRTTMYFASVATLTSLKILTWPEANLAPTASDVTGLATTTSTTFACSGPDGLDPCTRANTRAQTGWVTDSELGVMWASAQNGGSRPYPYTRVAIMNPSSLAVISQPDIWHGSYAWLYPAVSVNERGHIAGTIDRLGGTLLPGTMAFIRDDFSPDVTVSGWENYILTTGTNGASGRWGDYNGSAAHEKYPRTWLLSGHNQIGGSANANSITRNYSVGRERDTPGGGTATPTPTATGTATATPTPCGTPTNFGGSGVGAIPDSTVSGQYGTPLTISFNVSGITGPLTNVVSSITLAHSWVGDVDMVLRSPGGTASIITASRIGLTLAPGSGFGDSSDFAGTYVFSNSAVTTNIWTVANSLDDVTAIPPATYRSTAGGGAGQVVPAPVTNLTSAFSGLSTGQINGTWTLTVRDGASGDTGSVSAAVLTLQGSTCATPTPTATATATPTATATATATPTATATGTITPTPTPACPPSVTQGFDNITTLPGAGWIQTNRSAAVGTSGWFQGNDTIFPAASGATTSYVGANFNNTTAVNTISNWLISPTLTLQNGASVTFYTRTIATPAYPDRMQVRMSTNGTSSNVGTLATDVGDFTTLLVDINPNYTTAGYPNGWTLYTLTISGVPTPVTGRLAFRYFVENGGPAGVNSDYIGIDSFNYFAPCGSTNRKRFDYDGDNRADLSVFRPSNGIWYIDRSQAGGYAIQFGANGDKITPADFDGDGKTDVAIFRPSQATWYIYYSSTQSSNAFNFGLSTDIPAPGDYDGDNKADIAIYRPSTGTWWIQRSTLGLIALQFGANGDVPVGHRTASGTCVDQRLVILRSSLAILPIRSRLQTMTETAKWMSPYTGPRTEPGLWSTALTTHTRWSCTVCRRTYRYRRIMTVTIRPTSVSFDHPPVNGGLTEPLPEGPLFHLG